MNGEACARCAVLNATLKCLDCKAGASSGENLDPENLSTPFCDNCFSDVHSKGKYLLHITKPIPTSPPPTKSPASSITTSQSPPTSQATRTANGSPRNLSPPPQRAPRAPPKNGTNVSAIANGNGAAGSSSAKKFSSMPDSSAVQQAVLIWIGTLANSMVDLATNGSPLYILRDGIILCKAVSKLRQNLIDETDLADQPPKINISRYLQACVSLGLPFDDLFSEDLFEAPDPNYKELVGHLCALEKFAVEKLNFKGPLIEFQFGSPTAMPPTQSTRMSARPTSSWLRSSPMPNRLSTRKPPPAPPQGTNSPTSPPENRPKVTIDMNQPKPEKEPEGNFLERTASDKDISNSAFFSFVVTPASQDEGASVATATEEKEKILKSFDDERKQNETERKRLELQIIEEEERTKSLLSKLAANEQSQLKEVEMIATDNMQLKQGIESLKGEVNRLLADKEALQQRIKKTFEVLNQENKQLQTVAENLQSELNALKQEKKGLIQKMTEVTLGRIQATSPTQIAKRGTMLEK
eukprot:TRINITY_DN4497_c0_g1_i1.p1 TRINITY_DN4497_c0_g1~~TRINITY_DN4497_c0_g1_i1.p1  ORF type:complete len:525 (-),score=99.76 TRINITY_DN4497_c0_g1_i1:13-1587(-)